MLQPYAPMAGLHWLEQRTEIVYYFLFSINLRQQIQYASERWKINATKEILGYKFVHNNSKKVILVTLIIYKH